MEKLIWLGVCAIFGHKTILQDTGLDGRMFEDGILCDRCNKSFMEASWTLRRAKWVVEIEDASRL